MLKKLYRGKFKRVFIKFEGYLNSLCSVCIGINKSCPERKNTPGFYYCRKINDGNTVIDHDMYWYIPIPKK